MTVKFERTDAIGLPIGKSTELKPKRNYIIREQSLMEPRIEIEVWPNSTGKAENDAVVVKKIFGKEVEQTVLVGDDINTHGRSLFDKMHNRYILSSVKPII